MRTNRHGRRLLGEGNGEAGLHPLRQPPRLFVGESELAPEAQPLQVAARTSQAAGSMEARLRRADGGSIDVLVMATPLFEAEGEVRGAVAAIVDITERKQAEQRQAVLLRELEHRVKNTLANVGALASRMLRTTGSMEAFAEAFRGRIAAMAATDDLLSQRMWHEVGLGELAERVLAPFREAGGSIAIEGPEVLLQPSAATTIGLALHELATNAAKYGALSVPAGRVKLSWRAVDAGEGGRLLLAWAEQGGPAVEPAPAESFGTSFLKRSVEHELKGTVELDFRRTGLLCRLELPLDAKSGVALAGGL